MGFKNHFEPSFKVQTGYVHDEHKTCKTDLTLFVKISNIIVTILSITNDIVLLGNDEMKISN